MTSPWTLWGLHASAVASSCVRAATMCVLRPRPRRSCGAQGDFTALLQRPHGVPTACMSQSRATACALCMHKVHAVAWRPRRPHGVQWRCHGDASALWETVRRAPRRSAFFMHSVRTPRGRDPVWQQFNRVPNHFTSKTAWLGTGSPQCVVKAIFLFVSSFFIRTTGTNRRISIGLISPLVTIQWCRCASNWYVVTVDPLWRVCGNR